MVAAISQWLSTWIGGQPGSVAGQSHCWLCVTGNGRKSIQPECFVAPVEKSYHTDGLIQTLKTEECTVLKCLVCCWD